MDTGMDTLMHYLHPSSPNRRVCLSAMMIMTITGMGNRTMTTMTVTHILTIHTLIPQPRNPTLTRIQIHTPTLIHTHTPLPLLRLMYLRGDIFMYQPLTITPILNLLRVPTLILPSTPMQMEITHIRILIHTCTRQLQTA